MDTNDGTGNLLRPGSDPSEFTVFGEHLYFVAFDSHHGRELWRVSLSEATGTGLEVLTAEKPQVSQLFPNPTLHSARVHLDIQYPQHIRADVFDAIGRRVDSIDFGLISGGATLVDLELGDLASGSYFVRFVGDSFIETRMITVVR